VRQQGFEEADAAVCASRYPALMFQPQLVGIVVAIAVLLQSAPLFLALSAVLWWNALLPAHNPIDAVYNRLIAAPRNLPKLPPAPPPRRFAQGMAATFTLAVGVLLLGGWLFAAWIIQGLLIAALAALIFGRFCLGSYLFYLFSGKIDFANRTLPWAHG
ncbi:MAG TPA: DUF4395 family protein, partial [Desulfuromonadales bacterium]|nr:DUF4395 family protein [Desulfuromonadales bacterium]